MICEVSLYHPVLLHMCVSKQQPGEDTGRVSVFLCFFFPTGTSRDYFPIHPGRLTWNLQITHLERKMIFQTSMSLFHVNLPGCSRTCLSRVFCKKVTLKLTVRTWKEAESQCMKIKRSYSIPIHFSGAMSLCQCQGLDRYFFPGKSVGCFRGNPTINHPTTTREARISVGWMNNISSPSPSWWQKTSSCRHRRRLKPTKRCFGQWSETWFP